MTDGKLCRKEVSHEVVERSVAGDLRVVAVLPRRFGGQNRSVIKTKPAPKQTVPTDDDGGVIRREKLRMKYV